MTHTYGNFDIYCTNQHTFFAVGQAVEPERNILATGSTLTFQEHAFLPVLEDLGKRETHVLTGCLQDEVFRVEVDERVQ